MRNLVLLLLVAGSLAESAMEGVGEDTGEKNGEDIVKDVREDIGEDVGEEIGEVMEKDVRKNIGEKRKRNQEWYGGCRKWRCRKCYTHGDCHYAMNWCCGTKDYCQKLYDESYNEPKPFNCLKT